MRRHALIASLALAALSACTTAGYGPVYGGSEWGGRAEPHVGELRGPGVAILDDWLKDTAEGRAIVTLGFQDAADGEVDEDVAHRANIWFRRYADENRDMVITDPEIRTALVAGAGRYLSPR
jgi:hypothetical protein